MVRMNGKPMIIYIVTKADDIVYVGQTRNALSKRKAQHLTNARRGKDGVLGAAIRKHGEQAFMWEKHAVVYSQIDLDAAEKHFIAKYTPRYNVAEGGLGKDPWNKGLKGSQVAWNKGRKETRPDVISRISESAKARKPYKRGPATAAANEARQSVRSNNLRKRSRKFVCNETGKIYELVVDAARDLNISPTGIYAVLNPNHKMKSYKNYTFKYLLEL